MADLRRIAETCGITIMPKKANHPSSLDPKQTYSRGTIKTIAGLHGEDHIVFVLTSIISATQNETQLYGVTIRAISLWLLDGGYDERDTQVIKGLMSTIYLSSLREQVRACSYPEQPLRMADRLTQLLQNQQEWMVA
ncbi:hypothetical protein [Ahrensia sp. R2A130]|uniref:hypothetical protein n=1 Tax=Ahrensia sp. R2A130 TaxID=744979 RepID=UPI0001E0BCAA|nr:hypothetical protein [Ahrensia sp. R2A130]EFL88306.1 hypothetical protein R2A130_3473 [Ahrensia sp. R2A130]